MNDKKRKGGALDVMLPRLLVHSRCPLAFTHNQRARDAFAKKINSFTSSLIKARGYDEANGDFLDKLVDDEGRRELANCAGQYAHHRHTIQLLKGRRRGDIALLQKQLEDTKAEIERTDAELMWYRAVLQNERKGEK